MWKKQEINADEWKSDLFSEVLVEIRVLDREVFLQYHSDQ